VKECNSKQTLLDSLMKKTHSMQSQLQPSEIQTLETVHLKPLETELGDVRESESVVLNSFYTFTGSNSFSLFSLQNC